MTLEEILTFLRESHHDSEGDLFDNDLHYEPFAEFLFALRLGFSNSPTFTYFLRRSQWSRGSFLALVREIIGTTFLTCEHCDSPALDLVTAYRTGTQVCESCLRNYYRICNRCDMWVANNDQDHDHDRVIRDYTTRVNPHLIMALENERVGPNSLLLGVELEVEIASRQEDRETVARKSLEEFPESFILIKRDGSLSDGFELVSQPATPNYHRRAWDNFFTSQIRKRLKSYDTSTCGMHVHMTKAAVSELTLGKMLTWFNVRENRGFIEAIAARGLANNHYAQLNPNKKASDLIRHRIHRENCRYYALASWQRRGYSEGQIQLLLRGRTDIHTCTCPAVYNSERHEALNINTGGPTIEIRIFRGTLNRESFLKNLDFAVASTEFCTEMAPNCITPEHFIAWMKTGKRKSFPYLVNWLERKGWTPERPVPVEYKDRVLKIIGVPDRQEALVI